MVFIFEIFNRFLAYQTNRADIVHEILYYLKSKYQGILNFIIF